MKLEYLYRGLPGHPLHPPLTDATIGIYTFAAVAAVLDGLGISDEAAAGAWALGLVVGLVVTAPTALTGLADWLQIERRTPLWRTATAHLVAMVIATTLFLLAAVLGYSDGMDGAVAATPFVLTLAGFLMLSVGGWLGGTVVYVHGMRVLNLVQEPTRRAAAPVPTPEKEAAEGS